MTVIMLDAIKPNLLQTLENTPVLVHAGPFGNIANGASSVLADLIGIHGGDFLVTEAGFGADMGAERFFNIKCRTSGLAPDAAVVVATVRALKVHSGKYRVVAGRPLPPELLMENPDDVLAGAANLRKQVENIQIHFKFLYPDAATLREKIEAVAMRIYGARGVEYDPAAVKQLDAFEANGFGRLPVCIAKTHLSISSDPKLKGAPTGWVLPVREVRASVGAGFIYPICGDMRTMPGLPTTPIAASIDINEKGEIVGLS